MRIPVVLIAFIFATLPVAAQQMGTIVKPKKPTIDYTLPGAPMPDLYLIAYHDTTTTGSVQNTDTTPKKVSRRQAHELKEHKTVTHVTNADLANCGNLFMMTFNPTCLHCEDVTFMLEKNIDLFKRSRIILLANATMSAYLPDYAKRHHIDDYPVMFIGTDSLKFSDKVFLYHSLPQIDIYNTERKRIKTFTGDVIIDSLRPYIQ
jgi:hypothetical protein